MCQQNLASSCCFVRQWAMAENDTPNDNYFRMLRKVITRGGERVATGDMTDLTELVEIQAMLDKEVRTAIRRLRDEQRYSWSDIGDALGITRQAAQQKYGR